MWRWLIVIGTAAVLAGGAFCAMQQQVPTAAPKNFAIQQQVPTAASKTLAIQQSAWLACAVDDDCVVVASVCPDFYWSVNAKYAAASMAQNDQLAAAVTCGPPPNNIRPLRPHCLAGQCVLPRQP